MPKTLLPNDVADVRIKLLGILAPRALDGNAGNLVAAARVLEAYVLEEVSGSGETAAKVDEAPKAPTDAVKEQGKAAPPQQADPAKADESADKRK